MQLEFSDYISIISILIAIGNIFASRRYTKKQIINNRLIDLSEQIKQKADLLQHKSCEYWSAISMVHNEQTLRECDIILVLQDLKSLLEQTRRKYKHLNESIHNIQFEHIVNLDKLITGGHFQEITRRSDSNKCKQITEQIAAFKTAISEVLEGRF